MMGSLGREERDRSGPRTTPALLCGDPLEPRPELLGDEPSVRLAQPSPVALASDDDDDAAPRAKAGEASRRRRSPRRLGTSLGRKLN